MTRNSNYKKGTNAENALKVWFESQGAYVMRSAGSRGVADLLVFQNVGGVVVRQAIQCKSGELKLNDMRTAILALADLRERFDFAVSLWHYIGDRDGKMWWRVHAEDHAFEELYIEKPARDTVSPHDRQVPRNRSVLASKRGMHSAARRPVPTS